MEMFICMHMHECIRLQIRHCRVDMLQWKSFKEVDAEGAIDSNLYL